MWTNDGQKVTELPESSISHHGASENAMDQKFEELWCLTVEYRNWITAALNVVLSCDEHVRKLSCIEMKLKASINGCTILSNCFHYITSLPLLHEPGKVFLVEVYRPLYSSCVMLLSQKLIFLMETSKVVKIKQAFNVCRCIGYMGLAPVYL